MCGRSFPKSDAYHAEVEKEITNPITGEIRYEKVIGPVCPLCTDKCGYRVKKERLERYSDND